MTRRHTRLCCPRWPGTCRRGNCRMWLQPRTPRTCRRGNPRTWLRSRRPPLRSTCLARIPGTLSVLPALNKYHCRTAGTRWRPWYQSTCRECSFGSSRRPLWSTCRLCTICTWIWIPILQNLKPFRLRRDNKPRYYLFLSRNSLSGPKNTHTACRLEQSVQKRARTASLEAIPADACLLAVIY